jgi:DNA-binding NarL/FixJ family response regulator
VAQSSNAASSNGEGGGRKRLYLVDDHPIVREGLAQVLAGEPDFEVVGQAEEAAGARRDIARLKPDLAIIDLHLREGDGLELIKSLIQMDPGLRILVLTMHAEPYYAERALRAGAKGFLTKEEAGDQILVAIRKILSGDVYVSERISSHLLTRLLGGTARGTDPCERLSDREMQVFEMIGAGRGTKEIAAELNLSAKTIETYRANIKEKLGLKEGSELVRFAIRWSIDHHAPDS